MLDSLDREPGPIKRLACFCEMTFLNLWSIGSEIFHVLLLLGISGLFLNF